MAQDLESHFKTVAEKHEMMGGSLVVFCEDGIIESIAIGKADYARNIDMTEDAKYRIASISKTITAIAIMQLVEQNQLDLDANISSILGYTVQNPSHPKDPITVRMLLTHTSSVVDGATYSDFLRATGSDRPIPNLKEILTVNGKFYSESQFIDKAPGSYFAYSNLNYVILGTIVEKISNLRFDIYCKKNISEPLEIDASFNVNDLSDIDQLAVIYRKPNGKWTPQVDNHQGTQPIYDNLADYVPGTNGARFGPQGSFRCSAKDLAKIFMLLMNRGSLGNVKLLSQATCEKMFSNQWAYNETNGNDYHGLFRSWGLGIHRVTSTAGKDIALSDSKFMLGHAGEAYGLVSNAYFDLERKVGFIFMNNGVGKGYQTNNSSGFYTVEQEVFEAIENFGELEKCAETTGSN